MSREIEPQENSPRERALVTVHDSFTKIAPKVYDAYITAINSPPRTLIYDRDHNERRDKLLEKAVALACKKGTTNSALVLGARAPLPPQLIESFSKVTIVDYITDRAEERVHAMDGRLQEKIEIVKADMSRIAGELIEKFQKLNPVTASNYVRQTHNILKGQSVKYEPPNLGQGYNLLVSNFHMSQMDDIPVSYYIPALFQHHFPGQTLRPTAESSAILIEFLQKLHRAHIGFAGRTVAPGGFFYLADTLEYNPEGLKKAFINEKFTPFGPSFLPTFWQWNHAEGVTYQAFSNFYRRTA